MEKRELTPEEKIDIVFRMIKTWTPRSSETLEQVFPKATWPGDIRKCTLQEFLTRVFNNNPESVMKDGVPSAEAYVQEVQKLFGVPSEHLKAIQSLVASLEGEPNPFQRTFELLYDLAEMLGRVIETPFTCKIGHNFRIELWLDSSFMLEPLVQIQVAGTGYLLLTSTLNSNMVETNYEELQSEVLKILMDPNGVRLLRVACMYHQD